MAGVEDQLSSNWFDGSEDELVKELLDDESPFFFVSKSMEAAATSVHEATASPLIPNAYSGPTIKDIESALSSTYKSIDQLNELNNAATSRGPVSFPEKGLGKMDNKYSLKIKSSGNAMVDDGYKWRKYGQKSIKNSPYPRSYYRCTNPRCSAKKQVERSKEDPESMIVSYEGLHLHFAYTHFLLGRLTDSSSPIEANKRPRMLNLQTDQPNSSPQQLPQEEARKAGPTKPHDQLPAFVCGTSQTMSTPQGLLEDVVPLLVRNPLKQSLTSVDVISSFLPSLSSSSSSSSIISSPLSSHFDLGILAGIK